MAKRDFSRLKRKRHEIPAFVLKALKNEQLLNAYQSRPPYQQNDYIGWINHAKKDETKKKRLTQMLAELKKGNVYMKMKYNTK